MGLHCAWLRPEMNSSRSARQLVLPHVMEDSNTSEVVFSYSYLVFHLWCNPNVVCYRGGVGDRSISDGQHLQWACTLLKSEGREVSVSKLVIETSNVALFSDFPTNWCLIATVLVFCILKAIKNWAFNDVASVEAYRMKTHGDVGILKLQQMSVHVEKATTCTVKWKLRQTFLYCGDGAWVYDVPPLNL